MTAHLPGQPFMALIDDDSHSARLMIRMLLAHGAPSVSWMQGEDHAEAELAGPLADPRSTVPGLVIVDLKSSSDATRAFIGKLRAMPGGEHLLVAAMASGAQGTDPIRAVEAVTAGIAFLGAGAIFQTRGTVQGLTTAAGMWLAGAAGIAIALGYYVIALGVAVLAIIVLAMLRKLSHEAAAPEKTGA